MSKQYSQRNRHIAKNWDKCFRRHWFWSKRCIILNRQLSTWDSRESIRFTKESAEFNRTHVGQIFIREYKEAVQFSYRCGVYHSAAGEGRCWNRSNSASRRAHRTGLLCKNAVRQYRVVFRRKLRHFLRELSDHYNIFVFSDQCPSRVAQYCKLLDPKSSAS